MIVAPLANDQINPLIC